MASAPLLLRVVANSVSITHKVGNIVRDIMKKGDLGIVDKVSDLVIVVSKSLFTSHMYFV